MGCAICATGRGGFVRNLSPGEIVGQVLHVAANVRTEGERLSHVVYMGMGEPFANYDASLGSIRILNDPRGLGLGARSFTVSTVGIVPGIERFADEGLQVNLAVSLHAADDDLRARLLPVDETYPIDRLLAACRTYVEKTRRRITFEIALIDGVNDAPSQAEQLAGRLRGLRCHVNLIPFNPVPRCAWGRSPEEQVSRFASVLEAHGIPVTVRVRRGVEIQAGCGQLRTRRRG
jgi:23S rRNA (adenine2503-C2)-methyltransferase